MKDALDILIVATKSPWPPVDGGRVVVLNTLEALAAAGHRVTLVAPVASTAESEELSSKLVACCRPELVISRPRRAAATLVAAVLGRQPATLARHSSREVARRVAEISAGRDFDVVQAEQLQAVGQAEAAALPLVHRAHNVESALWAFAGEFRRGLSRRLFEIEARRLAAAEAAITKRVAVTVALTRLDLEPLRELAGRSAQIERIAVPYAGRLEPAESPLPGDPAVVTLASPSWLPSRDTILEVAAEWWPVVLRRLPEAVLHVFGGVEGGGRAGVRWHAAPSASALAFPVGAVAAIPARHPTGVPVKGLEAWARGLPLVASSGAAAALEAEDGRELLAADGPRAFAEALARLRDDADLRQRLVAGGREALERRHDPSVIAGQLDDLYRRVLEQDVRRKTEDVKRKT